MPSRLGIDYSAFAQCDRLYQMHCITEETNTKTFLEYISKD